MDNTLNITNSNYVSTINFTQDWYEHNIPVWGKLVAVTEDDVIADNRQIIDEDWNGGSVDQYTINRLLKNSIISLGEEFDAKIADCNADHIRLGARVENFINKYDNLKDRYDGLVDKYTKLHIVAQSGDYADLKNKPTLSLIATSGDYADLKNKPNLALVATSGDYNDLKNKPTSVSLDGYATEAWVAQQLSGLNTADGTWTPVAASYTVSGINKLHKPSNSDWSSYTLDTHSPFEPELGFAENPTADDLASVTWDEFKAVLSYQKNLIKNQIDQVKSGISDLKSIVTVLEDPFSDIRFIDRPGLYYVKHNNNHALISVHTRSDDSNRYDWVAITNTHDGIICGSNAVYWDEEQYHGFLDLSAGENGYFLTNRDPIVQKPNYEWDEDQVTEITAESGQVTSGSVDYVSDPIVKYINLKPVSKTPMTRTETGYEYSVYPMTDYSNVVVTHAPKWCKAEVVYMDPHFYPEEVATTDKKWYESYYLKCTFENNESATSRNDFITVRNNNNSLRITVNQEGSTFNHVLDSYEQEINDYVYSNGHYFYEFLITLESINDDSLVNGPDYDIQVIDQHNQIVEYQEGQDDNAFYIQIEEDEFDNNGNVDLTLNVVRKSDNVIVDTTDFPLTTVENSSYAITDGTFDNLTTASGSNYNPNVTAWINYSADRTDTKPRLNAANVTGFPYLGGYDVFKIQIVDIGGESATEQLFDDKQITIGADLRYNGEFISKTTIPTSVSQTDRGLILGKFNSDEMTYDITVKLPENETTETKTADLIIYVKNNGEIKSVKKVKLTQLGRIVSTEIQEITKSITKSAIDLPVVSTVVPVSVNSIQKLSNLIKTTDNFAYAVYNVEGFSTTDNGLAVSTIDIQNVPVDGRNSFIIIVNNANLNEVVNEAFAEYAIYIPRLGVLKYKLVRSTSTESEDE